jgi:SAM-dependent methyltransferase
MMLDKNLIKKCTCGNENNFTKLFVNMLPVVSCEQCGVLHQDLEDWTSEQYFDFYKTEYHQEYQENRGTMTYKERYDHDCRVADLRLDAYDLPTGSVGLDIGSSNSAFVHRANARGLQTVGLEPGKDIGDDSVTVRGTLETVHFDAERFDFVTMHDSIEHMIDVNGCLQIIQTILKPNGLAIIDLPDYFSPNGSHHWKHIEHLWFHTEDQFTDVLENNGYDIVKITQPIPGKLVFYARKK